MDRHRIVKGDPNKLSGALKELLLNFTDSGYGFSGLTYDFERFQALAEDKPFLYDLPTLEDLFIGYVKEREK